MTDFLDQKASQTGFAALVGCSQPAINKQAKKLGLVDGGTYREWLVLYVQALREEASGRSYTSESQASTLKLMKLKGEVTALDISNQKELKQLVPAADGAALLESLGKKFVSEIQTAQMQIINAINSKYEIEFDDSLVTSALQSAAVGCESHALELASAIKETLDDPTAA